jgi:hypothetical protein
LEKTRVVLLDSQRLVVVPGDASLFLVVLRGLRFVPSIVLDLVLHTVQIAHLVVLHARKHGGLLVHAHRGHSSKNWPHLLIEQ